MSFCSPILTAINLFHKPKKVAANIPIAVKTSCNKASTLYMACLTAKELIVSNMWLELSPLIVLAGAGFQARKPRNLHRSIFNSKTKIWEARGLKLKTSPRQVFDLRPLAIVSGCGWRVSNLTPVGAGSHAQPHPQPQPDQCGLEQIW